ncbi:uncharacterized protein [Physcomitrium patens]|uniref:uncharacterized protein n=1 Tax=Physcomitrium patens TaxID=3218 RepID=UPI000D15BC77|nr:uncharacterized protein LOC112285465 [Physcomitrium patens]|eukprot:XP_024382088.1 uncharacterized protein LOC112285465 [Physcomitrella patens]
MYPPCKFIHGSSIIRRLCSHRGRRLSSDEKDYKMRKRCQYHKLLQWGWQSGVSIGVTIRVSFAKSFVREVTAVKKDVIVLLDVGDSMGDSLPGDLLVTEGTSKLSVFVALVVELLDTVAYAITFNISGASVVLSLVSIHFDITFIQKSAAMTCQPSRKTLVFILL